jgi:hypothetical protein
MQSDAGQRPQRQAAVVPARAVHDRRETCARSRRAVKETVRIVTVPTLTVSTACGEPLCTKLPPPGESPLPDGRDRSCTVRWSRLLDFTRRIAGSAEDRRRPARCSVVLAGDNRGQGLRRGILEPARDDRIGRRSRCSLRRPRQMPTSPIPGWLYRRSSTNSSRSQCWSDKLTDGQTAFWTEVHRWRTVSPVRTGTRPRRCHSLPRLAVGRPRSRSRERPYTSPHR